MSDVLDDESIEPAWRVCDMPTQLRPREAFERLGAENVSDAVLLALILRTGKAGTNVVEVAQRLLHQFGSLTALAKASVKEIQRVDSIGPVKAQMIKAAMELAQRLARESVGERPQLLGPEQVVSVLRERVRLLDHEVVWALFVDTRSRLIGEPEVLFEGGLSSTTLDPKKVFKRALACSAHSMILAHNHPSGDLSPSAQDIRVTTRLIEVGHLMDLPLVDHLIVGPRRQPDRPDFLSLRDAGLCVFGRKTK